MNEAFSVLDSISRRPEDDEDDGPVLVADVFDPIAALLSGVGGEAENLTEELRKYEIKYEHLSGLSDEDLIILGMKNKKTREEVLHEIGDLPNQMEHYDGVMKTHDPRTYIPNVLRNVTDYLSRLDALLVVTQAKLQHHHVDNVQLDDTRSASEFAVSMCGKLYAKTVELQNLLNDLRCGTTSANRRVASKKPKKTLLRGIVVVSLLIGGGYLTLKYLRV